MTPAMSRAFRRTALTVQHALNRFDPVSRGADTGAIDLDGAPVFILAVPRSGSTLLYQLMARSMGLAAITNLMALAPCFMVRVARFSNARAAHAGEPLHPGRFGYLPGLHGFSEAGRVLERWFDPAAGPDHRLRVREMIAALTSSTGRPLLVKSLSLAERLEAVAATVPRARVVILHREPDAVLRSLLRVRSDPHVARDQWAGIADTGGAPSGDAEEELARRVAQFARRVEAARDLFSAGRVHDVAYEELCHTPRRVVARLAAGLDRPFDPERVPEATRARAVPRP